MRLLRNDPRAQVTFYTFYFNLQDITITPISFTAQLYKFQTPHASFAVYSEITPEVLKGNCGNSIYLLLRIIVGPDLYTFFIHSGKTT